MGGTVEYHNEPQLEDQISEVKFEPWYSWLGINIGDQQRESLNLQKMFKPDWESMEPSAEDNGSSATEEFSGTLWSPKVYYFIHNSKPLLRLLSYMYPAHKLLFYFCKMNFKIILSSTFIYFMLSFPFRCRHQNPICISVISPHVIPTPAISSFLFCSL